MELTEKWNSTYMNSTGTDSSGTELSGPMHSGWPIPVLIIVLTLAVNLFLLVQIIRTPQLNTFVNKLVVSMCVSAILSGSITARILLYDILRQNPLWCLCVSSFNAVSFLIGFLHFAAISIERSIYIVFPFTHERLTSSTFSKVLFISSVWTVALALFCVPLFVDLRDNWQENCMTWQDVVPVWVFTFFNVGVFGTTTLATVVCYAAIFIVTRRHIKKLESGLYVPQLCQLCSTGGSMECKNNCAANSAQAKKKAISKLRSALPFLLLFLYMFTSWIGNVATRLVTSVTGRATIPEGVTHVWNFLAVCSPVGNSLLYMLDDREVRRYTLKPLQICFSRNRVQNENMRSAHHSTT